MILKISLKHIANNVPILYCRTAWLLRYVICILIFSISTLLGQNKLFSQEYESELDPSQYPKAVSGAFIPLKPGQAILSWRIEPRGNFNNVVSATIIPSVAYQPNSMNVNTYGWGTFAGVSGESGYNQYYTICDESTLFIRSSSLSLAVLRSIQAKLVEKNLGTVEQRKNLISIYNSNLLVKPTDFRGYLQPWVVIGLVIAILFPAWYLMRRYLRG